MTKNFFLKKSQVSLSWFMWSYQSRTNKRKSGKTSPTPREAKIVFQTQPSISIWQTLNLKKSHTFSSTHSNKDIKKMLHQSVTRHHERYFKPHYRSHISDIKRKFRKQTNNSVYNATGAAPAYLLTLPLQPQLGISSYLDPVSSTYSWSHLQSPKPSP